MRGRCLGAIVDQLVLGRFLADLGKLFAKISKLGTQIEPRSGLGEPKKGPKSMAKSMQK